MNRTRLIYLFFCNIIVLSAMVLSADPYLYIGKDTSKIAETISFISTLEDDDSSALYHLNTQIEEGALIAEYELVTRALDRADDIFSQKYHLLDPTDSVRISQDLEMLVDVILNDSLIIDNDNITDILRVFTNIAEVKGLLSVNDCLIQNLSAVNCSVTDEVVSSSLKILPLNTTGIVHNNASGVLSTSLIVNADVSASAGIVDTKLATISTAGKVSNSATTATSANTANAIVARDASGNFSAGTISANLTGTVTGSASLNVLKAGDTMTGALQLPAGTAAAPSLRFTGSTTTGLSAPSANTLAISTNALQRIGISSAGVVTINALTPAGVVHNDASGNLSSSLIVNADVSASAAIVDTKLATISTAGKVANSATTATSANTASAIVARDASGNFSAGTITANLTGTVTGSASLNVLKAGDTMTGALQLPAGTAAAPSLRFTSSTTSGLSAPSANTLAISTNGSQRIGISSAGVVTINGLASAGVVHTDASGNLSTSLIVNADVSASAAIVDTKLATISTAGKVSNSATTATSANTASAIVARTATGGFSAGVISVTDTVASGNLVFTTNPSTSTAGNIMKGANSFIHNTGSANIFAGESAGNFTMTGSGNSGFGVGAIQSNTTGINNVAIGNLAMQTNSTGSSNVAIGAAALRFNTGGGGNVACGVSALQQNTTANFNTAIGSGTLLNNSIGSNNTGCGYNALVANTTGVDNTAVGYVALDSNTNGTHNTAVGSNALQASTNALRNTAVGYQALNALLLTNNNTAVGYQALLNSTQIGNVAIGYQAGINCTTGDNNIYIGNPGVASESTSIRIGTSGVHTACYIGGISGAIVPGAATVLINGSGLLGTVVSSERYKHSIQDMTIESEPIYQLRPVSFIYKSDSTNQRQYGLIAEEVDTVLPEIVVKNEQGQPETVQYHILPVLLLNEVQKLQKTIDSLKQEYVTTEMMNNAIKKLQDKIDAFINETQNVAG